MEGNSTLSYDGTYFHSNISTTTDGSGAQVDPEAGLYWWKAVLGIMLVLATVTGNSLVCLAIWWERRLQNVTNYFLTSLAITDLMVAVLVMPMGILILLKGKFELGAEYCLTWICLDVLFCTASIMHLCTISVDRYFSLRYPMSFGRNKTRRRVTLKIVVVWLLSVTLSLPLTLMYSQNQKSRESVLVDGNCQIPNPVYRVVGSVISFYIPLIVMLATYYLTVKLLADQSSQLAHSVPTPERKTPKTSVRSLVQRLMSSSTADPEAGTSTPPMMVASVIDPSSSALKNVRTTLAPDDGQRSHIRIQPDDQKEREADNLDSLEKDLWLQMDVEPVPSAILALHQFGQELLRFSSGLQNTPWTPNGRAKSIDPIASLSNEVTSTADASLTLEARINKQKNLRRCVSYNEYSAPTIRINAILPNKVHQPQLQKWSSLNENENVDSEKPIETERINEKLKPCENVPPNTTPTTKENAKEQTKKLKRERKSEVNERAGAKTRVKMLRRSVSCMPATHSNQQNGGSNLMMRNYSKHGRIIRLEQKATHVLGVVFFAFVVLWAPFFVLNTGLAICGPVCEKSISGDIFELVTWLGYASSAINPIFYTVFNETFRQAFKKVLLCRYTNVFVKARQKIRSFD